MPRLIDHLVIGTHDLDALGARFTALGFTVGARNRHPWGTENRIIQFADQTFLELITINHAASGSTDPNAENGIDQGKLEHVVIDKPVPTLSRHALGEGGAIPDHGPRQFSFGAFVRDALARRTGMSMLVLKSQDARADALRFAEQGIGDFEPFDFARNAKRPDGSETKVAFTLAFARDESMPEAGFFVCQQHFPENFWSKAAQTHANGALGLSRVSMFAENPSDSHIFLSAFADQREIRASSAGIEINLGNAQVESLTPLGFAMRYGVSMAVPTSPSFAGFGISFPSLDKLDEFACESGEIFATHGNSRVIHANLGLETVILLEQEPPE